jgi:DNA-directed RNA polymerase sigma subunit (sigma70/sigma32)
MSGDMGCDPRQREAEFGLEDTNHRHGDRHQRGLRVGREREVRLRSFEHQRGKFLAQRLVDLLEDMACGRERVRQLEERALAKLQARTRELARETASANA